MKKLFFATTVMSLIFIGSINLYATESNNNIFFTSTYNYTKEQNYLSMKFSDPYFSSVVHTQLFPQSQIEAMSFSLKIPNFTFQAGDITFSGTKSKMANPSWSTIDALRNAKASEISSKAQSKSFESSIANSESAQSVFAQITLPFENKVKFAPVFSAIYTPNIENSFFIASAKFPFTFSKNKLAVAMNYGRNFLEQTDSTWFMKSPYFSSGNYSFFQEELSFNTKFLSNQNFSSYINFFQNESSSGIFKLGGRAEACAKINFSKNFAMSTEARIFLSQFDTPTISGKILKESLHYCAIQKFFIKSDENLFTIGASFDSKYFYQNGKEYESATSDVIMGAFKADFFLWNFTLKYKYKISENANDFYLAFWADLFSSEDISIYLSGNSKLQSDLWSTSAKLKTSFFNTSTPLILETKFSYQDNYNLEKGTFINQTKISFYGFQIGSKITTSTAQTKKATSSQDIAFDLSCSYSHRF